MLRRRFESHQSTRDAHATSVSMVPRLVGERLSRLAPHPAPRTFRPPHARLAQARRAASAVSAAPWRRVAASTSGACTSADEDGRCGAHASIIKPQLPEMPRAAPPA